MTGDHGFYLLAYLLVDIFMCDIFS